MYVSELLIMTWNLQVVTHMTYSESDTGCQIFVVFVSNTLVYEMGGVSYLLNFRFWPGVKRPHETNLIEKKQIKPPKILEFGNFQEFHLSYICSTNGNQI